MVDSETLASVCGYKPKVRYSEFIYVNTGHVGEAAGSSSIPTGKCFRVEAARKVCLPFRRDSSALWRVTDGDNITSAHWRLLTQKC